MTLSGFLYSYSSLSVKPISCGTHYSGPGLSENDSAATTDAGEDQNWEVGLWVLINDLCPRLYLVFLILIKNTRYSREHNSSHRCNIEKDQINSEQERCILLSHTPRLMASSIPQQPG